MRGEEQKEGVGGQVSGEEEVESDEGIKEVAEREGRDHIVG